MSVELHGEAGAMGERAGPSMRPEVCVGAIVLHLDQLLLVRRGRGVDAGRWSIPGGRVEPGETLAEAVVRELAEETALEGVCDSFVGWVELVGEDHHFVILDFAVTVLDPSAAQAGDDAADVRWVPVADVAEMTGLVDGLAEFLHEHGIIPTIA